MSGTNIFNDGGLDKTGRWVPLIFLVDTSGSMDGPKISTVNQALTALAQELAPQGGTKTPYNVHLALITFGADYGRKYLGSVEQYVHKDLHAGGLTPLGAALKEAHSVIKELWAQRQNWYTPVMAVISDGMPSDDYEQPLSELKKDPLMKKVSWFVIGVEDGGQDTIDNDVLIKIAGPEGCVYKASNVGTIKSFVKTMTWVTTSKTKTLSGAPLPAVPAAIIGDMESLQIHGPSLTSGDGSILA